MDFEKLTLDGRQETRPPGELKGTSRTAGAGASGNSTMDTTDSGAGVNGQHEERPGLQPLNPVSDDVSEDLLRKLSTEIGSGWKRIARRLQLKEAKISQLVMDFTEAEDRVVHMFLAWKQKFGNMATRKKLMEALDDAGRKDLADLVSKYTG